MLTGPLVLLLLKIAVAAVTLLLGASLVALWLGRVRLHGRINLVFFALTTTALLAFEVVIRLIQPGIFDYLRDPGNEDLHRTLLVHLGFAVPSACLLPALLYTGLRRRRRLHLALALLFAVLWTCTFVTGIFFLPHTAP